MQPVKSTEEKLKRKAMIATAVVIVGHVAAFLVISNMKKDASQEKNTPVVQQQTPPQPQSTTVLAKPSDTTLASTNGTVTSSVPASQPAMTTAEQEIAKALANHPDFKTENNTNTAPSNTTTSTNTSSTPSTVTTPSVPVITPNLTANTTTAPAATTPPSVPAGKPSLKVVDSEDDMVVIEVRKPTPSKPTPPVEKTTPAKPTQNTPVTAKVNTTPKPATVTTTAKADTKAEKIVTPKAKTPEQDKKLATTQLATNKTSVPTTKATTHTVTTQNIKPVVSTGSTTAKAEQPKKVEPKANENATKTINKEELIKTVIIDHTPRQISAASVQWASRPTFAKQDVAKYLGSESSIAQVIVRMEADVKGNITHVSILQSSGNIQLDRYVLGQVKTSRVKPSAQPIITQLPFRLTTN